MEHSLFASAQAHALMRQDWAAFIQMHAPEDRLTAFITTFQSRWEMKSKDYWSTLGSIWYHSERYYDRLDDWRDLLESPDRSDIEYFMDDQDRRAFSKSWLKGGLPRLLTVHRGFCHHNGEDGFSWTLNEEEAWRYAKLSCHSDVMRPRIATGLVTRNDVIAIITGKGLVCLPENVHGIKVTLKKGMSNGG